MDVQLICEGDCNRKMATLFDAKVAMAGRVEFSREDQDQAGEGRARSRSNLGEEFFDTWRELLRHTPHVQVAPTVYRCASCRTTRRWGYDGFSAIGGES